MTKRDDELIAAKALVRFCELETLAAQTAIAAAARESTYSMRVLRNLQTVDHESDPLLRSVYEAQLALELLIENLKMTRIDLDNTAAAIQELRRGNRPPCRTRPVGFARAQAGQRCSSLPGCHRPDTRFDAAYLVRGPSKT
jgi:hypothetical protein